MATPFVPIVKPIDYLVPSAPTILATASANLIHVAFINNSTVSDKEVNTVLVALQQQVSFQFSRAWGITAQLHFYPKSITNSIPSGYWQIELLNNTDGSGALGYHMPPFYPGAPGILPNPTNTLPKTVPCARVFTTTSNTALGSGNWSTVASHELLEMLADPNGSHASWISPILPTSPPTAITVQALILREVCDPVESIAQAYKIGTVLVSDFVTPAWYDYFSLVPSIPKRAAPVFNIRGNLKTPLTIVPDGSATIYYGAISTGQVVWPGPGNLVL